MNHVDCAKVCKSNCLSFTFDHSTKECATFRRMLCRNDTAAIPHSLMLFNKVDRQISSNPVDCSEIDTAVYCSGVYRITPSPGVSFDVYCDLHTADGPWTVIQNRENGDVNFYRPWEDYRQGFGNVGRNFWLGNEALHYLTIKASILRIQMVSWLGDAKYAQYSTFKVENETENYKLTIYGFSGNTSDCMFYHNGMSFSTYDRDNDLSPTSCAENHLGGWWYNACHYTNLNGAEYSNRQNYHKRPVWENFYTNSNDGSLRKTKMLLKHVNP
ncbi:angiopoietin-related protein 7-like [Ylistrum balloti]|uniref:angiopoietin-related protein 7-like n=1 Tax=Ylistrum balloti TaxID=509963 RepID=UPI002905F4D3|nr:angiopoietin-related protein 7-like [Ylistrum balloti]